MADTSPRPQVNFRIDADLLAAIKAKSAEQGISVTDLFINAAKTALGVETMDHPTLSSLGDLERLVDRIDNMENRLGTRLAELEAQQSGELVA